MICTTDLYWLAGLLEGEGCFGLRGPNKTAPFVQLAMSDEDVVARAAKILGSNYYPMKTTEMKLGLRKQMWMTQRGGVGWLMTLYPLLGARRRGKILQAIGVWMSRATRARGYAAVCHPRSQHYGRGLCRPCYSRERAKNKKDWKFQPHRRVPRSEGIPIPVQGDACGTNTFTVP